MDLFAASGIDLGDGGRGGRSGRPAIGRTLKVPLLNYKVVVEEQKRFTFDPTPQQRAAAVSYAETAKSPKFAQQKETAVRSLFIDKVLGEILGYAPYDPERLYTLAHERTIRSGAVDVALGRFGGPDNADDIVAPFELKGPGTRDLDAIMPGRGRSPVQQALDYAIDAPASRWVLVSNCVEVRLYGFGRGRDAYELFDLTKLDDPDEHARLCMILSAERLIAGATDALLRESDSAYKDITGKLYKEYKGLHDRLIAFLAGSADGPRLPMAAAIELAQKLLDRILFVAFAQRTDLLPDRLLERASTARNEFLPEPVWKNFRALFREIDQGNEGRGVWAYNGGLFAIDQEADALVLPDLLATDLAGLGQWDYRSDVPVTVLGHLFEQSITDLEKLRAESRGEEAPKISKRKREGVIYTPEIITRFLVEHTVGKALEERFVSLLRNHAKGDAPPKNGDKIPWRNAETSELAFWHEYALALRNLKIVDPACGSGAFLVAAFDLLAAEYRRVLERLSALGKPADFDPFDEIVTKNLYGVDLNAESVEITRLALWLKTARNKHRLQNLAATIKVGNSLIDDPAFTDRPFNWHTAFPEVFAQGGFDIVVGNPPYVRMELIKPVKPYLEKHYVVADDRTDLYAYFFERGVALLKEGGRLGYISSSTFFRTGSGENLRRFLGDNVAIEAVIDFGDLQIFEGVTTYPAIVTLCKDKAIDDNMLAFLKIDELPTDLDAAFTANASTMPRARLGTGSWQFADASLARLRDKIVAGKRTLGEIYGAPFYGIKTGLNDAFIIDLATRDRLVAREKKSAKLLTPFLRGENIKRWRVESESLFLINTPKGKVDIDAYPAIRDWLLPFRPRLEKRATKQEWFELQQAQLAYQPGFSTPKIIYGHFAQERIFAFDAEGYFSNDKSYFIPNATFDLLSILSSKVAWSFITSISPAVRGGFHEMRVQYLERVPIPKIASPDRKRLAVLGEDCTVAAKRRFDMQSAVCHRILDLAPPGRAKLSRKLDEWWTLDFTAFRDEIKRAFRAEIPIKARGEWESYLAEHAAQIRKLDLAIEKAEREIDAIVYRLFELAPEEIALLEDSISR